MRRVNGAFVQLFFSLCLTVDATVNALFSVGQLEDMGELLLSCSDTTGILALDYVSKLFGKSDALLFNKL